MDKVVLYIALFFIYAFIGWLLEVGFTFVKDHKLINRGFLIGPICPIYGHGCLLILLFLNKYSNQPFTLFIMAMLICSVLEYFTSYLLEKIFKARWWDYSDRKYNINGRICLETLIPFGILGLIIVNIINPFFTNILNKISYPVLLTIVIILSVIYIADNIISFFIIKSIRNEIKSAEKDYTEAITKRVREIISQKNYLHRRLLKAFPDIKTPREILLNIKTNIDNKLKNKQQ